MSTAEHIAKILLDQRTPDGHWVGQLSASALSTATAVSAFSFYSVAFRSAKEAPFRGAKGDIKALIDSGISWLIAHQNDDGGWGDTDKNYSNISTTMLVVAAFAAAERAGCCPDSVGGAKAAAEVYIKTAGGIDAVRRRYGKDKTFAVPILANCAMAGMVPWKEVSALPFEAACVPQRFYHLLQLPVVSYAIPALVAIGQCKFINDPPWDPVRKLIRKSAIGRSLKVLQRMQPQSGGFLEAIPLTAFVSMALIESGRWDHPVVENGIRFLVDAVREDGDGNCCWPIDTNLATWGTTLAINALANDSEIFNALIESEPNAWRACVDWVLSCQNQEVHPFTGSPPGGWGWTDLTGSVPDADDTPGALLAMRKVLDVCRSPKVKTKKFDADLQQQIIAAADKGIDWLLRLQNRDRGWPTFCRGWSNLPFDRSGADLTAHVVRALSVWRGVEGLVVTDGTLQNAIDAGVQYLKKTQRRDGSWLPLWFGNQDQPDDINPFYGTAKVIQAFADLELLDTKAAEDGLNWIVQNQNADGGFGGGVSVAYADSSLGQSTVEETALCVDALLNSKQAAHRAAAVKGVDWLRRAVAASAIETCHPIGFYFAKLWYHEKLYPIVFAMSAMAKFTRDGK
jgi:squalene-hopene/tetraprenyl-beta-curcumene cyclase